MRERLAVRCAPVAVLGLLLLLLPAAPTRAASGPGEDLGGTGLQEPDEGLGGTGLQDPDDGIGGTGVQDLPEGIAVTGLYGTVTMIGALSLTLNDRIVEVDPARTVVEWDGVPVKGDLGQVLAPGQVVWVQAAQVGQVLVAQSVAVLSAAAGPVAKVDFGTQSLEILGQPVELAPDAVVFDRAAGGQTDLSAIAPGDFLRVSGLRRPDGTVVASRVERDRPRTATTVVPAPARSEAALDIAGARLELREGAALPELAAGRPLRLDGRWDPQRGVLDVARGEAAFPLPEPPARLSLEGFVDAAGPGSLRLHGLTVDLARLPEGAPSPRPGARVEVSGTLTGDTLAATRLRVVPPQANPAAGHSSEGSTEARPDAERSAAKEGAPAPGSPERPEGASARTRPERPEVPRRIERPQRPGAVRALRPESVRPERPIRVDRPERDARPVPSRHRSGGRADPRR